MAAHVSTIKTHVVEDTLALQTNSSTRLQITSAGVMTLSGGNVGIGTSAPVEALTVVGHISATGTVYTSAGELGTGGGGGGSDVSGLSAAWNSTAQTMSALSAGWGVDLEVPEKVSHTGDTDTYLLFDTNLVNLVAGGKSAIKLQTSTGKIQINNGNEDLDLNVMADDGEVILSTDAANNKVGIGTTSPVGLLDIQGFGSASNSFSDSTSLGMQVSGAGHARIRVATASEGTHKASYQLQAGIDTAELTVTEAQSALEVYVDGDEVARFDKGGNVGIGTTAPAAKLHVDGGGSQPNVRVAQNTTYFTDYNINSINTYNNDLYFAFDAAEKVRFKADGKVGIGTTAPAVNLDFGVTSNNSQVLNLRTNTNSKIGFGVLDGYGMSQYIPDDIGATTPAFQWGTMSNTDGSTFAPKLTLLTDGKVGIGTTAPGQLLHVVGSSYGHIHLEGTNSTTGVGFIATNNQSTTGRQWRLASSGNGNFDIRDDTAGAIRLSVEADGNVGIGTTAPDGLLHLERATTSIASPHIRLTDTGDVREASIVNQSGDLILATHGTDNAADGQITIHEGGAIYFSTGSDGATDVHIDTDGNVGIGTTSPSTGLDIQNSWGRKVTTRGDGTGDYTIAATDNVVIIDDQTESSSLTVTLPAVASSTGRVLTIIETVDMYSTTYIGVVVQGNGGSENLHLMGSMGTGDTTSVSFQQAGAIELICDGTKWYVTNDGGGAVS